MKLGATWKTDTAVFMSNYNEARARVDPAHVANSLLLTKGLRGTSAVRHTGGVVFTSDMDPIYQRWLRLGALRGQGAEGGGQSPPVQPRPVARTAACRRGPGLLSGGGLRRRAGSSFGAVARARPAAGPPARSPWPGSSHGSCFVGDSVQRRSAAPGMVAAAPPLRPTSSCPPGTPRSSAGSAAAAATARPRRLERAEERHHLLDCLVERGEERAPSGGNWRRSSASRRTSASRVDDSGIPEVSARARAGQRPPHREKASRLASPETTANRGPPPPAKR